MEEELFTHSFFPNSTVILSFVDLRWAQLYVSLVFGYFSCNFMVSGWFYGFWRYFHGFPFFKIYHRQQCNFLLNHQNRYFWGSLSIICDYFRWSPTIGPTMRCLQCILQVYILTFFKAPFQYTVRVFQSLSVNSIIHTHFKRRRIYFRYLDVFRNTISIGNEFIVIHFVRKWILFN